MAPCRTVMLEGHAPEQVEVRMRHHVMISDAPRRHPFQEQYSFVHNNVNSCLQMVPAVEIKIKSVYC